MPYQEPRPDSPKVNKWAVGKGHCDAQVRQFFGTSLIATFKVPIVQRTWNSTPAYLAPCTAPHAKQRSSHSIGTR